MLPSRLPSPPSSSEQVALFISFFFFRFIFILFYFISFDRYLFHFLNYCYYQLLWLYRSSRCLGRSLRSQFSFLYLPLVLLPRFIPSNFCLLFCSKKETHPHTALHTYRYRYRYTLTSTLIGSPAFAAAAPAAARAQPPPAVSLSVYCRCLAASSLRLFASHILPSSSSIFSPHTYIYLLPNPHLVSLCCLPPSRMILRCYDFFLFFFFLLILLILFFFLT